MNYFDKDFTVIFDNNGYKTISDEDVYTLYPFLIEDFISAGESFKDSIPKGSELSILFRDNKFFVNGEEFPLFSSLKSTNGHYYEEFKDCVGYWWFLPGVNVVTCGGVSIVRRVFDVDDVY
nr:hypothetical protein [uncultured Carboxylicivirga sp.]